MKKEIKKLIKKILPPKDKTIPNTFWARGKVFGHNQYRKELLRILKKI